MTIAASVQDCLAREGVHYDMIAHERTRDSNHTAQAAHIPGDRLAKCVVLEDDKGYLMAVIPASHKVDLGAVHRQLNRTLGTKVDRKSTRLNSSHQIISYAVFCLKKKNKNRIRRTLPTL